MNRFTFVALGIILAIAVLSAPALFAQSRSYDAAYARQAKADIATIEAAYAAARDRINGAEKLQDATEVYEGLAALSEKLASTTPPVAAAGVHEQTLFAVQRCQNFVNTSTHHPIKIEGESIFEGIAFLQAQTMAASQKEYCAVQIHAARLRVIDYGVANGVNPYAK